jgi:inner membrane protein
MVMVGRKTISIVPGTCEKPGSKNVSHRFLYHRHISLYVDSFTHSLVTGLLIFTAGRSDLIVWGVLGGVILDLDVLLFPLSDPFPSWFILTHGGITHTLIGAAFVSAGFYLVVQRVLSGSFVQSRLLPRFPGAGMYITRNTSSYALFAMMMGAFLHLGLDCCAMPGLPLFYPISQQKYTLGMLSGVSGILLFMSLIIVGLLLSGRVTPRHLKIYAILFLAVLLFSAGMKLYVSTVTTGMTVPTLNPFFWWIIEENGTSYQLEEYGVFHGAFNKTLIEKYENISSREADPYLSLPETRRVRYFSYLMVTERTSFGITFHDPLREARIIWYPPYYTSVNFPNSG